MDGDLGDRWRAKDEGKEAIDNLNIPQKQLHSSSFPQGLEVTVLLATGNEQLPGPRLPSFHGHTCSRMKNEGAREPWECKSEGGKQTRLYLVSTVGPLASCTRSCSYHHHPHFLSALRLLWRACLRRWQQLASLEQLRRAEIDESLFLDQVQDLG